MSREILSRAPIPATRRVPYGHDPSQFLDLFLPKLTTRRVAIMIHGGYWRSSFDLTHASHLCSALSQTGLATASLEYRRAGDTGGGWPTTFDDVMAGFHAVRKYMGPAPEPVVLGHSAGGQLALRLASAVGDISGVVALAPVACMVLGEKLNLGSGAIQAFLGGTPEHIPQVYAAADPAQHASTVARVLMHGTSDDVVPPSISRAFVEARKHDAGTVRLIEIPGADHFDLIDPSSKAWPLVLAAVRGFAG